MPREKAGQDVIFAELVKKNPVLLSREEAAELLRVSVNTVQRLTQRGKISSDNGRISLWSIAGYLCG